jgi:hypothetical protein
MYIHDFVTKLRRQQAEVIQNHENVNVHNIGQGEVQHRKYKIAQTWWRLGIRKLLLCLSYKTWAGSPGMYIDILFIKWKGVRSKILEETIQNVRMYISLDTDKNCDLLQDRLVLLRGLTHHDKPNLNCLEYSQNLVISPGGARRKDGLTDR